MPILLIVVASLLLRIWYALQNVAILWDSAMYVGIAKYMFSGGTIGVFESFRPPLLPVILGLFWKAGFQPFTIGILLSVCFSTALVWVIYKIGYTISKNTGIYAALFIALSGIVIENSNAPLTDVISTFFTSLAVLLVLNKKYFWSGICVAVAFGLRFPQGLILLPIGLYILIESGLLHPSKKTLWQSFTTGSKFVGGFLILFVPYLIVNYFFYHDPLLPIVLAQQVASSPISSKGREIFYYTKTLLILNPFFIFFFITLIPLYIFIKKIYKEKTYTLSDKEKTFIVSLFCLVIIGGYFNFSKHIELRYSVAFIPFLSILAAYGIDYIANFIPKIKKYSVCIVSLLIIVVLGNIFFVANSRNIQFIGSNPTLDAFYGFFNTHPGAQVLTSSPEIISYSNIRLVEVADTWESMLVAYTRELPNIDYVAINSCSFVCESDATCQIAKNKFTNDLTTTTWNKVFDKSYQGLSGMCSVQVFKK